MAYTTTWLTPPGIVAALGPFDLDPCAPAVRPWPTAALHYSADDDGLSLPWHGRVWLNPPYGPGHDAWMRRMAEHGSGIALMFSRTDAAWFQDHVLGAADSLLFVRGRLKFMLPSGAEGGRANAPSVFAAYSAHDTVALRRLSGMGILWERHVQGKEG